MIIHFGLLALRTYGCVNGSVLQSNSYGSASREFPPSLTIDQSSGEFYVSSNTEIGFDAQQPIGGSDASLARFTSNGSRIWKRIFGTTQNDYVAAIEFDQVHKLIQAGVQMDPYQDFILQVMMMLLSLHTPKTESNNG